MWHLEISGSFDRMSDGVAEIQQRTFPGNFAIIRGNNLRFDGDVSANQFGVIRYFSIAQIAQHFGIPNDSVFDDLGVTLTQLLWRKGIKCVNIGDYE